jgi:hypothetical protein
MTMTNLERIENGLTSARRKRVDARARQLIAEEMSLRQLRAAQKRTQASVAKTLGIGQDSVSRLEQRSDILLSTLRAYIEAVGGQLSLIAKFPDRDPVILSSLATLRTEPRTRVRTVTRRQRGRPRSPQSSRRTP